VLTGRTGETASGNGTLVWAGRIADSYYIDMSLLALVNGAVAAGTEPDLSGWRPQDAKQLGRQPRRLGGRILVMGEPSILPSSSSHLKSCCSDR
jgi:hypothetical protein